ncbi:MAG TPA: MFS transporter [Chloroflexota bacterium]|nr:MFS transporter [Chloroflexota bacterium]
MTRSSPEHTSHVTQPQAQNGGSAEGQTGDVFEPSGSSEADQAVGYGAVLKNHLFLLIWAAQLLSQTAQNVINFAVVVEVERLTQSSTNVSWVIVSFSLPAILLGPLAGVFVDRTSKRAVLLWTNILRALLMLAFLLAPITLQSVYAMTFAASAVSQFFLPAEGAMIPLIVRRRELMTATSLFNLTFTGAQVAGFVLVGPLLYKIFGDRSFDIAVVGVIVMYSLAAACVAAIRKPEPIQGTVWQAVRRAMNVVHVWKDMLETRRFVGRAPGLTLAITHLTLATAMLMAVATLGPGFVNRVLGLGAEDTGYILAPAGVGMIASTALLGQFAVNADRRILAGSGLLAMGILLVALGYIRPVFNAVFGEPGGAGTLMPGELIGFIAIVCIITALLGVAFSLVTIPAQTLVTEATEESIRGRVFALLFMLTQTASAVPVVVVGVLADTLGIVPMLASIGVLVSLVGLWTFRSLAASDRTQ